MPIIATNFIEDAFSPLISAFEWVMVFIHDNVVGGSWGLAIVGLTIVIRGLLVPLTFRQLKAMQEMQRHVPEMQALKEKYKDDKQRQQQELMNFYREHKINPLASCLPLLLQFPVFISLFYMLRSDLKKHICGDQLVSHYNGLSSAVKQHFVDAGHTAIAHAATVSHVPAKYIEKTNCNDVYPHSAKFLFLPDITNKATGAALIVLIVLYVGSQLASTLVATATADANQRRMLLLLPFVFVFFLFKFPAGLLVYWITTNLWTIGQQLVIRRVVGPPPTPPAKAAKGGGGSDNGKAQTASAPKSEPALAGVSSSAAASPPPRPPRKKKKRSGRRR
jgi:YidC/Oxa1 family membrane protein insertase